MTKRRRKKPEWSSRPPDARWAVSVLTTALLIVRARIQRRFRRAEDGYEEWLAFFTAEPSVGYCAPCEAGMVWLTIGLPSGIGLVVLSGISHLLGGPSLGPLVSGLVFAFPLIYSLYLLAFLLGSGSTSRVVFPRPLVGWPAEAAGVLLLIWLHHVYPAR